MALVLYLLSGHDCPGNVLPLINFFLLTTDYTQQLKISNIFPDPSQETSGHVQEFGDHQITCGSVLDGDEGRGGEGSWPCQNLAQKQVSGGTRRVVLRTENLDHVFGKVRKPCFTYSRFFLL